MFDFTGHVLTFKDVEALLPLWKEAQHLERILCNGGALHIILEDGNYEDANVQWCIDYIKGGEYAKDCIKHGGAADVLTDRQLAFAVQLMQISAEWREMVCGGNCITEEAFDALFNTESIIPVNVPNNINIVDIYAAQ